MNIHRIVDLSFAGAWLDCTCGATVRGDEPGITVANGYGMHLRIPARAGTPEALKGAYERHRAAVGAPTTNYDVGQDRTGQAFGNSFRTSIGTSAKSAAERGRMGVAAKKAKAAS